MYCSQCGIQNSDTARFCVKCGKPISQPATPYINPLIQKVIQGTPEQIKHFRDTLNKVAQGDELTSTNEKASLSISKDLVELIYEDVLDLMIKFLESGMIEVDESKVAAKIVVKLDKAITYGDADKVLAELAQQFPIYQSLYEKYHRVLIGFDKR
jgi:hypothetical protein